VTPCVKVDNFWVLELFHGPTFAFKDVALQFLGNLFEYFLSTAREQDPKFLTIIGATSGDTGSAAIYGLRGKKNIGCYVLFPQGQVSKVQEKQMTTVLDANIHCFAIKVLNLTLTHPFGSHLNEMVGGF
jgi:threonine synthase